MKKLLYILLIVPMLVFSQNTNENYVVTKVYKEAATEPTNGHDKNKVMTNIQYFDGLGRLKQTVALEAGGLKVFSGLLTKDPEIRDIVTHVSYDALGRQKKEYLPFADGNNNPNIRTGDIALGTQNYYRNNYAEDFAGVTLPTDVNAYSEKRFDNSPLNRVTHQAAPGTDWKLGNNHEIRFDYQSNQATEVRAYYVTTSFSSNTYTPTLQLNTSSNNGYYKLGKLYKTITKNENWQSGQTYDKDNTYEEFKNKEGQIVLKRTYNKNQRHDTYYVYDDFGNLTFVLPPKMEATSNSLSTVRAKLNDLGYQYKYDNLNRLVEKKIPGKGWEFIVYDKLDRPVMTQDANLGKQDLWLFTKYDHLGRVAYTGTTSNTSFRKDLQRYANTGNYTQFEKRELTSQYRGDTRIYYSATTIPTAVREVYTVNYYDTYIEVPDGLGNSVTTVYGQESTTRPNGTKGLPTVSKVRVLGTHNWITTVTYYDDKGRPIYVYSKNDYLNKVDIVESKLNDFSGKLLETTTTHRKTGKVDVVTVDRFEYDHMDRLLSQTQQINDQVSERIVKNNYDDLGQLESKLVGNGTKVGYKDVTSGITINNSIITKTAAQGWSHGLATQGNISGDGYVEFITNVGNKFYMVGLSQNNTNASYSSIDYAIYINGQSSVKVYESGGSKLVLNDFNTPGSVFRVERIGDKIYYKKNGETFYISTKTSSGTLLGDISIHTTGTIIKDFKIVDNSKGLQKVDYKYNVRGWLTKINEDSDNDNDLFNFELGYNKPTGAIALFNGNISQARWQTENVDNSKKSYNYYYDALNRITSALDNTRRYDLGLVTYDKNGNILTLKRTGATNSPATNFYSNMDDLVYTYDSGNKLRKVKDNGYFVWGFRDGSNTDDDYTYDANGNMTVDKNKGITYINYNHLNLPTRVFFNAYKYIDYKYDASGVKLEKRVVDNSNVTKTDYAGNHMYENGELQFFNQPEGYVKNDNVNSTLLFDSSFNSGTDGWSGSGASIQNENGRLKVVVSSRSAGANKTMTVSPGDKIDFSATIDKGTTNAVYLEVIEQTSSGSVISYNLQRVVNDSNGIVRGSYVIKTGTRLRVKVAKYNSSDNGVSTIFYMDNVKFSKSRTTENAFANVYQYKDHLQNIRLSYTDNNGDGNITQNEIVEEKNYYPFGLQHKGYNDDYSSSGNSIANKFGYNSVELEEALGLNLMEMDVRMYDPAIGRFNGIDPVTHFPQGTSVAFDNNPIYWADPSGADSENYNWVAQLQASWDAYDIGISVDHAFGYGNNNNSNLVVAEQCPYCENENLIFDYFKKSAISNGIEKADETYKKKTKPKEKIMTDHYPVNDEGDDIKTVTGLVAGIRMDFKAKNSSRHTASMQQRSRTRETFTINYTITDKHGKEFARTADVAMYINTDVTKNNIQFISEPKSAAGYISGPMKHFINLYNADQNVVFEIVFKNKGQMDNFYRTFYRDVEQKANNERIIFYNSKNK